MDGDGTLQLMSDDGSHPLSQVQQGSKIDAADEIGVVEHVDEVFSGQVAAGTFGERRPAQPANGSIEAAYPGADRLPGIGQSGPPGVVQVQPHLGTNLIKHPSDPTRRTHTGGIGQGEPGDTDRASLGHQLGGGLGGIITGVCMAIQTRTTE